MADQRKTANSPRPPLRMLAALLVAGLSGCADALHSKIDGEAAAARATVEPAQTELDDRAASGPVDIHAARPWLGLHRLRFEHGDPLPPELTRPDALTLGFADPLLPEEFAARLSAVLDDIPVRLTGDLPRAVEQALGDPRPWRPEAEAAPGAPAQWTGPLDELLDGWTTAYGYDWRYRDGRINIRRGVTALLRIDALAGGRSLETSLGTQSAASGGGGGASSDASSSQRLTVEYDVRFWEELETQIESLAIRGTSVVISPATGTVAVRGRPADVRRIQDFLREQNRDILRPVTVTIEVVELTHDDSAELDLGIAGLLRNRLGGYDIAFDTAADATNTILVSRPSTATGGTLNLTARALAERASSSRRLRATVSTLNGVPVTSHDLQSRTYLASVSSTTEDGVTTETLNPGSVTSGFFFSAQPRIVAADRVLLRLNFSLTALRELRAFSSGTNAIQLPDTDARAVTVERSLRPGETLVVHGFSDIDAGRDASGPLHPSVPLGGQRNANLNRTDQVLLVTVGIEPPPDDWTEAEI